MATRIIKTLKVLAWAATVVPLLALPVMLIVDDETLYAVLTPVPYVGQYTDGIVNRKHAVNAALGDFAGGWIASMVSGFDRASGSGGAAGKAKIVMQLPPPDTAVSPGRSAADKGWAVTTEAAPAAPAPVGKDQKPGGAPPPAPPPAAMSEPPPPPALAAPKPPARTAKAAPEPLPKAVVVPKQEPRRPPSETEKPATRPAAQPLLAAKPPAAKPAPAAKDETAEQDHRRGMLFYKGIGVDKDFKKAAMWFRRAAEKGHAAAQYNLGIMTYLGQGVEQDYAGAAEWFKKAGEQDHAAAQYNLGFLYFEGKGVPKDSLQAYMWIDRAANLGDDKAAKARDTLQKALPREIFNR
jgi:outer membrane biosynthesis protein TonB